MKRTFYLIIILIALVSSANAQPDTLWTRTFGGLYNDYGHSVQQTSDDGFIIVGTCNIGSGDVYLVKTDENGNEQWIYSYGRIGHSSGGKSVQQTSDGGYIIVGYSTPSDYYECDVYLIKTNQFGDTLWTQTYGGDDHDCGYSVRQTLDGGYIITGNTDPYLSDPLDVYLIKTDRVGNEEWSQSLGGPNEDSGFDVQQASDGGYIITGESDWWFPGTGDVGLIKTDEFGNEEWAQSFGGDESDYGSCVQQTTDGGYIIAGTTKSYGSSSNKDFYLIKTDASGSEQWNQIFDLGSEGFGVLQTSDGGYIIAGYTGSIGAGSSDVYIIKTDQSGNEDWSQTYGGSSSDEGHDIQPTSDGGYIIAGYTFSYGAGNADVWLVRLAPDTGHDVDVELTYLSGSPVPAGGGNLNYDLIVENMTALTIDFDGWLEIAYEGGNPTTVAQRHFDNHPPGLVINYPELYYPIPASYAAGNYTFTGKVGYHPDVVWDSSGFSFIKEGSDRIAGFVPFPVDGAPNPFEEIVEGGSREGTEIAGRGDLAPTEFASVEVNPNPFNPTTVLSYELRVSSSVSFNVFDINGREVAELVDGWRNMGTHEATWNASHLSSGIYIYRLTAGKFAVSGKMVLMK